MTAPHIPVLLDEVLEALASNGISEKVHSWIERSSRSNSRPSLSALSSSRPSCISKLSVRERPKPVRQFQRSCLARHSVRGSSGPEAMALRNAGGRT